MRVTHVESKQGQENGDSTPKKMGKTCEVVLEQGPPKAKTNVLKNGMGRKADEKRVMFICSLHKRQDTREAGVRTGFNLIIVESMKKLIAILGCALMSAVNMSGQQVWLPVNVWRDASIGAYMGLQANL